MISQTAEYALRAVVCLAMEPATARTAQSVAEATRVPAKYMAKVLQDLGKAGLVSAQRGLHGGFTLARPAGQISILDVVRVFESIERIESCPLGLAHHTKLCPLHRRLDDAIATIERSFGKVMVSQLIDGSADSTPLCDLTHETPDSAATARADAASGTT